MATVVRSFAIQGIDGYPADIEVKMDSRRYQSLDWEIRL